jgi:hypothetical protein
MIVERVVTSSYVIKLDAQEAELLKEIVADYCQSSHAYWDDTEADRVAALTEQLDQELTTNE